MLELAPIFELKVKPVKTKSTGRGGDNFNRLKLRNDIQQISHINNHDRRNNVSVQDGHQQYSIDTQNQIQSPDKPILIKKTPNEIIQNDPFS